MTIDDDETRHPLTCRCWIHEPDFDEMVRIAKERKARKVDVDKSLAVNLRQRLNTRSKPGPDDRPDQQTK
jgi:hypothetical protein